MSKRNRAQGATVADTAVAEGANPDLGGIVHLDHVNFETPDHDMASAFFMAGLGLTRDPFQRTDEANMGVNVGLQQFHLPRRGARTPPFHGLVGLVVPDLDGVRERLAVLEQRGRFAGTPYRFEARKAGAEIVTPFGYRLRLHAAGTVPALRPLGLAYVDISVPPGRADGIARFYRRIMHAPADVRNLDGAWAAAVTMGPHQYVRFVERDLADYATHSMHISYYLTGYNAARDALRARGLVKGAGAGDLFFFATLFDPDSGAELFSVNNEVRSLYHPDFMRPLANRWPLAAEPFEDRLRPARSAAPV